MIKVKYCGPALDYSGYGEANRHDIASLVGAGVDVSVELTRHCLEISDFGSLGQMIQPLVNKQNDHTIKILHTTPNIYGQFIEPNKYHIARAFWETNLIPADFARGINYCNEVWTGSEYNAEAMRKAGVVKPIYIIPEAIDTTTRNYEPYAGDNVQPYIYNFYSIFEWTERKNPLALLEAFWREFEGDSNVCLVIKTYVDNFTKDKQNEITSQIKTLKNTLNLTNYAPVYLFKHLMDRQQVYRFHATYDCFVSAHRGEGWGIPQMEAMFMGKPIISTACGGIHEHIKPDEAMLLPYKLIPLVQNSRNQQWYTGDQMWADVDIAELRKSMRWAFSNQTAAREMGGRAYQAVLDRFSTEVVGKKMLERLLDIHNTLI